MKVSFSAIAFEDPNIGKRLSISVLINDKVSLVEGIEDTDEELRKKIPKMVEKAKKLYLRSNQVQEILSAAAANLNDNQ